MARIRSIKPEFFIDEELQDLEASNPGAYCMLVYAALWGHCSKEGVFEYRPRILKLAILPFLKFDLTETLLLLECGGFICRFCVDGKEYGLVKSFEKHQRISGKEAQYSPKYPTISDGIPCETTGKQRGSNGEAQERERERERERELKQNLTLPSASAGEDFPLLPVVVDVKDGLEEGKSRSKAEVVFERCWDENGGKIKAMFPALDFVVERAKCVAYHRNRAPPIDPLLAVLRWCESAGKSGKLRTGPLSASMRRQLATFQAARDFCGDS